MSLYKKYRPDTLEDIIGNEAQVESIKSLINKKDKPHTYIITGPSGCGKTTMARILAKEFGADELSIREVNTADNRGIDTARDIIQQIRFASPSGSPIIFIIDEVHKTTNDWQNAMLKPLEDTPNHVYFFLCTTDPQKIIKAIHTRSTPIKMMSLKPNDLFKMLRRVNRAENKTISKEILEDISDNAQGSPRQALVIYEKIMDMVDEDKINAVISTGLDSENEAEIIDLCRALLKNNSWDEIKGCLSKLKNVDPEKARYAVLGYMSSVLLKRDSKIAAACLECFAEPFYNQGKSGLILACYQVKT